MLSTKRNELEQKLDEIRDKWYAARDELFNAGKALVKAAENGGDINAKAKEVKQAYDECNRLENILSDLREKLACKK